jgi:hypothetical protein
MNTALLEKRAQKMKAKLWKGSYHWDKKRGAARKEDLRGIT